MTESHTETPQKITYDLKTVRRFRNFLIQVLILLDERRKNPNKPDRYVDPTWDYEDIKDAIVILDDISMLNMTIDIKMNKRLIDTYEMASRHYYSRIMNLYNYYRETDGMIKSCNGNRSAVGINLLLAFGGPREKAA